MYLIKDFFGEAALRRAFGPGCADGFGADCAGWAPAFGVEERDHEIELTGELPGVALEDVEINLEHNVLTVSGEKRDARGAGGEETESKRHLMERSFGRFSRSFTLPRTVQAEAITADLENGVLKVRLPKAEEARTRKIEVRASA